MMKRKSDAELEILEKLMKKRKISHLILTLVALSLLTKQRITVKQRKRSPLLS